VVKTCKGFYLLGNISKSSLIPTALWRESIQFYLKKGELSNLKITQPKSLKMPAISVKTPVV